jgi:hypothetical protein
VPIRATIRVDAVDRHEFGSRFRALGATLEFIERRFARPVEPAAPPNKILPSNSRDAVSRCR